MSASLRPAATSARSSAHAGPPASRHSAARTDALVTRRTTERKAWRLSIGRLRAPDRPPGSLAHDRDPAIGSTPFALRSLADAKAARACLATRPGVAELAGARSPLRF